MTLKDCTSPAMETLRNYKLASYIAKFEEFETEEEIVGEILSRSSASALMAYQAETCTYEEFCDFTTQLEQFCTTYGYDFNEYCYGIDAIKEQRGAYR